MKAAPSESFEPALATAHDDRINQRRNNLNALCAPLLGPKPSFVWEVGCGHGHFLVAYASAHPEQLCLGIDINLDRIQRADRKKSRAGLANLHFIRADAADFLAALPEAARFEAIFVLFPDPWPKRRHHKNRLLGEAFLEAAAQRAGQGTRLYFRTDHEPYYKAAVATLEARADWKIAPRAAWPLEIPTIFQQKATAYHSLIAERT